jgi:phosphatidylserine/phosphatidylglycerophosphate/cardiolipin synthase-like enzyme
VDNSTISAWFAPNTQRLTKGEDEPSDMHAIEQAIAGAKKAVLFLAFKPGRPSFITYVTAAQIANPSLFVRGAATDTDVTRDYNVRLYNRGDTLPDAVVDTEAVADEFSYWKKELLKLDGSHAIIHDKIIVTDPLSDTCTVITGSHNLGYTASYQNDENILIIKGNKKLAAMYAVHVMDIYNHYRWRFNLVKEATEKKYPGLDLTDAWQDRFFAAGHPASTGVDVWFGDD